MSEDVLIRGKAKDLGGFMVARILPTMRVRHVGPFVFIDHMGPLHVDQEHALDVRPHPHIGLATVTYLYAGKGLHRDSLGNEQIIAPGDLNWMTAGRGIVHSERTPKEERVGDHVLHGIQIWVALPKEMEDCEPGFVHYPKVKMPDLALGPKLAGRLLIGAFANQESPVVTHSRLLFIEARASGQGEAALNFNEREVGVLLIEGGLSVNGQNLAPNDMVIAGAPDRVQVQYAEGAHFMIFGGEPFPEARFMWWNFVSSSKEKIRVTAEKWRRGERDPVKGEVDFIPLPNDPLP